MLFAKNIDFKLLTISAIHFMFTFFSDYLIFEVQGRGSIPFKSYEYIIAKIAMIFILFFMWKKILHASISKYKYSLIYGALSGTLMIFIWPGIWRWDDLITLAVVTNGNFYFWQHWLSSYFDLLCLQIIPIPAGIVIIQCVIASLVIGNIVDKMLDIFHSRWVYVLYIFTCLPAIIDNLFYPIRSSVCAFIELYIIFFVIRFVIFDDMIKRRNWIFVVFITGLLSAWRPENIVYVFGIPFILFVTKKVSTMNCMAFFISVLMLFSCITYVQNLGLSRHVIRDGDIIYTEKEKYVLSGIVSPLGELLKGDITSNDIDYDLSVIDKVISVDMICSTSGLNAFWNGGLKDVSKENLVELNKVYAKLVFFNSKKFFFTRMHMFFEGNGIFTKNSGTLKSSEHLFDEYDEIVMNLTECADAYKEFQHKYVLSRPVNVEVRKQVISAIEMKRVSDWERTTLNLRWVFFNTVPILFFMLLLLFYAICKRDTCLMLIYVLLFIKAFIVFVTEPAPTFMYWFSTYLVGGIIVIVNLIKIFARYNIKPIYHR